MDEKMTEAFYWYMVAHVNMHSLRAIKNPDSGTLSQMFSLLAPPYIEFASWCDLNGIEMIDKEEENSRAVEQLSKNYKVEDKE